MQHRNRDVCSRNLVLQRIPKNGYWSLPLIATYNWLEAKAKAKASGLQGQGQRVSRPRPRPTVFEAKAMIFCPRAVLEAEDSPWGPHPWWKHVWTAKSSAMQHLKLVADLCINIESYQCWVVQSGFCKVDEQLRQSCRKQQRLPRLGETSEDGMQLVLKSHLK